METQVNDAEQLWTAASQLLRAQVSEAVWLSTFQDAQPVEANDDRLVLAVPSTPVRERIEGRYLEVELLARLVTVAGTGAPTSIDVRVARH